MFKVGDQVTRSDRRHKDYGKVHTVTETFDDGWFNHDGPSYDCEAYGGCSAEYWRLVPVAHARSTDPTTSKGKRKVNKYEQAVLGILKGLYGWQGYTGKQIASLTGHPLNCITPRFAPLRRKGLIKAKVVEGAIVKRDKQIVWVLA